VPTSPLELSLMYGALPQKFLGVLNIRSVLLMKKQGHVDKSFKNKSDMFLEIS
jgi:hypothetical protein